MHASERNPGKVLRAFDVPYGYCASGGNQGHQARTIYHCDTPAFGGAIGLTNDCRCVPQQQEMPSAKVAGDLGSVDQRQPLGVKTGPVSNVMRNVDHPPNDDRDFHSSGIWPTPAVKKDLRWPERAARLCQRHGICHHDVNR